ncbi:MtnX-like HAD-IB family phosphatase [Acinetobacter sp. ANC 4640]
MVLIRHNLPSSAQWHILCDFDGTISLNDTTDKLLETFAKPGWVEIEQEWEQGKIGSKVCMQRQIELLDMSKNELYQCLDDIEIDTSFLDFVHMTIAHKIPLTIVSDGMDVVIKYILKKYNLAHLPIVANRLVQVSDRDWKLEFPNTNQRCISQSGTCKCKVAERHFQEQIILIGDGRSDFCLAETADYVFAKKSLIHHCVEKNIEHAAFKSFIEIQEQLMQLIHSDKEHGRLAVVTV